MALSSIKLKMPSKYTWMGVMHVLILLQDFGSISLSTKGLDKISRPCLNKYCQRVF